MGTQSGLFPRELDRQVRRMTAPQTNRLNRMRNRVQQLAKRLAAQTSSQLPSLRTTTTTSSALPRLALLTRHFTTAMAPNRTTARLVEVRQLMKDKHVDIYGSLSQVV